MKQFSKPPIGASITVTTRHRDYYYYRTSDWKDTVYTGRVLPDEKWFKGGDFKLTNDGQDGARISFRVINLKTVVDLKVNGKDADQTDVDDGTEVVEVHGSKGARYWVTIKDGSSISCTCPGFTYRNQCRHLKEAVGQVDSTPKVEDTKTGSRHKSRRTSVTVSKRGKAMSKSKTLGWNDRFALIDHFKPNDEQVCTAFGITQDELKTARDMRSAGAFTATPDVDFDSYNTMFAAAAPAATPASTKTTTRKGGATSTKKVTTTTEKPTTATKKTTAPKKRGRKGDKIANAFEAIPTNPTPVEAFATKHGVSIAVLRQSKRFDKSLEKGSVRVKKDKESKTLMIWRETPTSS